MNKNNWISVEDKLPEDYKEVMYLAISDSGIKKIMIGHREDDYWTSCYIFYQKVILNKYTTKVTHWMELPNEPT